MDTKFKNSFFPGLVYWDHNRIAPPPSVGSPHLETVKKRQPRVKYQKSFIPFINIQHFSFQYKINIHILFQYGPLVKMFCLTSQSQFG